ncbi:Rft protein-domain-containing protein [Scleroderma citrinum]
MDSILQHSLSSVRDLIGLQLVSRLFTFVLNQGLVRLASPRAYGTVAVQFELFTSTILFLSREGIRNALLRVWPQKRMHPQSKKDKIQAAQCANLATLPVLLGIPITFLAAATYMCTVSEDARQQPHFNLALFIYAAAAVVELCSEPMHNRAMGEGCTSTRVRAEGLGISSKTVVTYLALLYDTRLGEQKSTLLAFALGQLTYGVVVFVMYTVKIPDSRLWPTRLHLDPSEQTSRRQWLAEFFDPTTFYLSVTMTLQSIVKHFLTEGDKLLVSYWSPLKDQGGYAIAVNYGSLIARIVFQPIEEICRVYFSRVLSHSTGPKRSSSDGKSMTDMTLKQASDAIEALLSIQIVFSILVVTFGSLYLPMVVQVLLPSQYLATSASQVLSAWVWYIPFLAINGGLEAFHSSTATPEDLRKQSWWMLVYSSMYIISAILFYRLGFGDASLVYANVVNLSARIVYTMLFTLHFFRKHMNCSAPFGLADVLPDWRFLVAVAVSYVVISVNESKQHVMELRALVSVSVLLHFSLGVVMGLVCVATWWTTAGRRMVIRVKPKVD